MSQVWKNFDLFSTKVSFTYQGRDSYSTNCGRVITLTVVIVFLILCTLRLTEFIGGMDPIEYFSLQAQSFDEAIDLQEIGFTFAV